MLVNPSGLEGHAMPMDLNIEHLIGDLKVCDTIQLEVTSIYLRHLFYFKELFAAKGIYANWDRLGNISACVNHLQSIKKQVCKSVKASYQGSTHSDSDTSILVWRIANKTCELKLQIKLTERNVIKEVKPITDLRNTGRQKFESASLATFNKKIQELKAGNSGEREIDDITIPNFLVRAPDNID